MKGAIILRCGDSRNGGVEKALKRHFGWPSQVRIKTVAVAGGAHAHEVNHLFMHRQVEIYTSVLLKKGCTDITVVLAEHADCGYVKGVGGKKIGEYWTQPAFVGLVFGLSGAIQNIEIMSTGYEAEHKPVVPSAEITITSISSVRRKD